MDNKFEKEVLGLLETKQKELEDFIDTFMYNSEKQRLKEDLLRFIPTESDINNIKMKLVSN